MDAWSSPWGDDGALHTASRSNSVGKIEDILTKPFSSLNAFDASDPWSNDAPPTALNSGAVTSQDTATPVEHSSDLGTEVQTFQDSSFASAAWGDASSDSNPPPQDSPIASPSASHPLPATDLGKRTPPARQPSLSSYDPWTADAPSAGWGIVSHGSSSAHTAPDPHIQSSGWGATDLDSIPKHGLEERFSSAHLDDRDHSAPPAAAADGEQEEAGSSLDVWAAEASSREENARRLDREEIDKLKVNARKLISSINTELDTQASFAPPNSTHGGWTDLFGSQGSQREKLHHLQTPPSSLVSSSGALRSDILQCSPATLGRVRNSIANTENRGVRLTSVDNNLNWQRGSRPVTKANWLPDQLSAEADDFSLAATNAAASANASNTSSGPGWMQTSSNETRSAPGPSFIASFFKNRQASAAGAAASNDLAPSPTISQARISSSSFEASPGLSANAHFEPYRDAAGSKYTDDPTGPDLMSLDTAASSASASVAPSKPAKATAPAQGPGLLSRWRNSGLFKASAAKKQNPSWASTSLQGEDLDWLEEHESSDSRISRYNYDDDDADADESFASFRNSDPRPPSPPAKQEALTLASKSLDPFDNLFGPAVQTSLQSGANATATSSARSSLSSGRVSGEGGMMTINTNLGRASSIARKSTASPLQPPPQAQNKRVSLAPPPRANAASSSALGSRPPQQSMADPFADFLTDAPSQPIPNPPAVRKPPRAPVGTAPSANSKGGGLTADDLLFFDSL